MNDTSIILHEFLLLTLNLAQMKHRDRVVELFQQAWNAHDLPLELNYSNAPVEGEVCEPIATHKNAFGCFILRKKPDQSVSAIMPLARNLIKLLAVILENLQRETLLEKERCSLQKKVEARVAEIKQAEKALEKHKNNLEKQVEKRTEELRKIVNLMSGREVRMAELKREIARLKTQLERAGIPPHPMQHLETPAGDEA